MALKEDYKDATFSGLRKYKNVDNGDGTVSMVDVTDYAEQGDRFGAKDVNAMTKMINSTGDDFREDLDYAAGDYAVHDNKVWKFTSPHPAGPWDESHVEPSNILKELAEQNKNLTKLTEKMNTLDILLDIGNYGAGTYALKKDLSSYKEIIVVVSYIANNSNTTCSHIPIIPFKELPQDQYGWYIPIYETTAAAQTVYVRYVDDTNIQITNATNAIVRAIYGSI